MNSKKLSRKSPHLKRNIPVKDRIKTLQVAIDFWQVELSRTMRRVELQKQALSQMQEERDELLRKNP